MAERTEASPSLLSPEELTGRVVTLLAQIEGALRVDSSAYVRHCWREILDSITALQQEVEQSRRRVRFLSEHSWEATIFDDYAEIDVERFGEESSFSGKTFEDAVDAAILSTPEDQQQ